VTVQPPQGTYVVFPDVRSLSDDSEALCRSCLSRRASPWFPALHAGSAPAPADIWRICFATSHRILQEGV